VESNHTFLLRLNGFLRQPELCHVIGLRLTNHDALVVGWVKDLIMGCQAHTNFSHVSLHGMFQRYKIWTILLEIWKASYEIFQVRKHLQRKIKDTISPTFCGGLDPSNQ